MILFKKINFCINAIKNDSYSKHKKFFALYKYFLSINVKAILHESKF